MIKRGARHDSWEYLHLWDLSQDKVSGAIRTKAIPLSHPPPPQHAKPKPATPCKV
ncbi:hypothetical protein WG78_12715 [Amantichitinum ursilacus]|uniref:Uncharacterized protein n=1 Tax=Amantichitinum ursilacus TaxID=857265 RepID=A0A0N1JSH1_9NEIS|nr:hypothetical protein WG78_12715 [Amantichitinum ursilacus]